MNNKTLNENYKKACLTQTKNRLNEAINKFMDDETMDSSYKSKIADMIISLLTLSRP